MGVDIKCPLFNHTSLVEVFANWGIKYTMADKTAKSVPYVDISDVEYLKRRFLIIQDQDLSVCRAPLNLKSLYKQMAYRTKVKTRDVDHMVEVLNNVRIESLAHEPEVCQRLLEMTEAIFLKREMIDYMLDVEQLAQYYTNPELGCYI